MISEPLKSFIIYANEDEPLRAEFESHLRPLVDLGWIEVWSDKDILPGEDWNTVIKNRLSETEIYFMLVSVDFYNSGYIRKEEFKTAVANYEADRAIVVPIIIRHCSWEYYPVIKDLQILPPSGVAVSDLGHWGIRDKAWESVVERIAYLIENMLVERNSIHSKEDKLLGDEHSDTSHSRVKSLNFNTDISTFSNSIQPPITNSSQTVEKEKKGGKGKSTHKMPKDPKPKVSIETPTNGQAKRDRTDAPEMVFVKGGTFHMGSSLYKTEQPIHLVNISSFWIGKYPVIFSEYDQFCNETKRKRLSDEDWERGNRPAINVSWDDAEAYCAWLSQKTGKPYRLPSEAEWEFAARGGTVSSNFKFAGSETLDEAGWYVLNSKHKTHSIGEKVPNELGIYDMCGNVWEWCLDFWSKNYDDVPSDGRAFIHNEDDGHRILRGGSWGSMELNCRVSARNWYLKEEGYIDSGFRLLQPYTED